ncbi:3-oxo-delta(4,5)-steroid 5-beta-reductase-like protein [Tanacetum coccineum]
MEDEFYYLTVKGNDLKTYVRRFQELVTLCPTMVPDAEKMIEVFIGGLPRSIKGNVTASKAQTLEEAINIAQRLIDQVQRSKLIAAVTLVHAHSTNAFDIGRRGTFTVGDDQFPASLFDLPCIVESHKTYDDSVLIKTVDVGQFGLECGFDSFVHNLVCAVCTPLCLSFMNKMEEENPTLHVALIVGVTRMVGVALAKALKKATALGGPWKVYGVARRTLPVWFPSSLLDEFIMLDTLNKENTSKMLSPISSVITHLFWVAISVNESEEINISRNSSMLSNMLYALTSSPNLQLCHVMLQTGTKQYMGPILDIDFSNRLVPHDAPFREDYPRLPFPNFYYALEDILASYPKPITYSIHRSSLIIGASSRSYFNMLLSLSVYALICKHRNYPFRYAGNKYSWEHFWDMSDARVLAEQQIWASVTDTAKIQAFNCTNYMENVMESDL